MKILLRQILCLIISAIAWSTAWAHPVAFKGSVGIMGYHSASHSEQELNYSLSSRAALGAKIIRIGEGIKTPQLYLASFNALPWRINGNSYQANWYLLTGLGHYSGRNLSMLAGGPFAYLLGTSIDAESRKLYGQISFTEIRHKQGRIWQQQKARFGFAPYIADYEKMHTWLILEASKEMPSRHGAISGVLRFFFQNVLWEVGSDFSGAWQFNYIIHL